jgi:rare lipoprotein A
MGFRNVHKFACTLALLALIAGALSGCGSDGRSYPYPVDGPGQHRDVSHVPDAVPKPEPRSRGGNPGTYVVLGKRYYTVKDSRGFVERGIASWYGRKFHGRKTSNGEVYDMYTMSAAHKKLPIPTYVEVKNLENGRRVTVRVNDRGPFHDNRIIDLSYAAASRIGMLGKGTALVEIRAIDPRAPKTASATRVAYRPPSPGPTPLPASDGVKDEPRIFLQAGAFNDSENAERLRKRLERRLSRSVRVTPARTDRGQVHRVQVGPLGSVAVADNVTAKMHEFGISKPLVVID